MDTVSEVEKSYMKKKIAKFNVGDTVDVHIKIREGDRERIQVFTGTVIARRGSGTRETFTVRRIVAGEGVERVFPIHSPVVTSIKIRRRGKVRRAKLYYLRERVGKATKVKELIEETGERKKSRTKKRGKKARKARAAAAGKTETPEPADEENSIEEETVAAEE
jgi:large subunit ribosomal protein L19